MKSLYQMTIRLPMEKAELLDKIRKEKGISWNALAESAFDEYLKTVTAPAEPKKVNNTEPKIALLSEKKKEEKEDAEPDTSLDMSKLNLSLGDDTDGQI